MVLCRNPDEIPSSRLLFGVSSHEEILTDLCELWQMFKVSIVTGPILRAPALGYPGIAVRDWPLGRSFGVCGFRAYGFEVLGGVGRIVS